MHSRRLTTALTEFIHAAASELQSAIDSGAEVPFELGSQTGHRRRGATPLYCYRALTGEFIAQHQSELQNLPGRVEAEGLLAGFEGLDRYLENAGTDIRRTKGDARKRAAIRVLLTDVFHEQSDFEVHPERLDAALQRLEQSAFATISGEVMLVATLEGLTMTSPELSLTKGLSIAHPDALEGMPPGVASGADGVRGDGQLIVALNIRAEDEGAITDGGARDAIARGREVLTDLLRALRLFGDGRVTLGALGWTRVGHDAWSPLALGPHTPPHGMLVVTPEQEDELRAFCNLVSRRAPHANELAWALRRFELGSERDSPFEALSDHLLALRALLEPEGPSSGLLAERLAALCATPEQRGALTERILAAVAMERAAIAGKSLKRAGGQTLAREVADHLRALLRDVICGHLPPDLPALADELLAAPEDVEPGEQNPNADPLEGGERAEGGSDALPEPVLI